MRSRSSVGVAASIGASSKSRLARLLGIGKPFGVAGGPSAGMAGGPDAMRCGWCTMASSH
eukprot:8233399-Alexandrium_andersonii.AAC.1